MRFLLLMICLTSAAFAQSFYGIKETTIEGKEFSTDSLKGKVVLVVNIASQCGYTSQLEGLEALWRKNKAKDFVLLGVPTNDFMGQTPEDDKGMKEFCTKKYQVSFPLLNKRTVKGKEKRPLYKFITEGKNQKFVKDVSWNFEKALISKKGEIIERFSPGTSPDDSDLVQAIEKALAEKN